MYVHSVKLINFKSIGDYPENEIILEPRVTSIIGKNESGKSNVLDGLSQINFFTNNPSAFGINIINRNSDSGIQNSFIVTLKSNSEEIEKGICEDTRVEIVNDANCIDMIQSQRGFSSRKVA